MGRIEEGRQRSVEENDNLQKSNERNEGTIPVGAPILPSPESSDPSQWREETYLYGEGDGGRGRNSHEEEEIEEVNDVSDDKMFEVDAHSS